MFASSLLGAFLKCLVVSLSIDSPLTAFSMLLQMCVSFWPSTWNLVNWLSDLVDFYWIRSCLRSKNVSWGRHHGGVTGTVFFLRELQHPNQLPQATLTKHCGFTGGWWCKCVGQLLTFIGKHPLHQTKEEGGESSQPIESHPERNLAKWPVPVWCCRRDSVIM